MAGGLIRGIGRLFALVAQLALVLPVIVVGLFVTALWQWNSSYARDLFYGRVAYTKVLASRETGFWDGRPCAYAVAELAAPVAPEPPPAWVNPVLDAGEALFTQFGGDWQAGPMRDRAGVQGLLDRPDTGCRAGLGAELSRRMQSAIEDPQSWHAIVGGGDYYIYAPNQALIFRLTSRH